MQTFNHLYRVTLTFVRQCFQFHWQH